MSADRIVVFYDVECLDYGRLSDRRLVTDVWMSVSISHIAADIIERYTSGFTHNRIEGGLPVVDFFPATNARPSELLRRLANLAGGGFYIDRRRPRRTRHAASKKAVAAFQTLDRFAARLDALDAKVDLLLRITHAVTVTRVAGPSELARIEIDLYLVVNGGSRTRTRPAGSRT